MSRWRGGGEGVKQSPVHPSSTALNNYKLLPNWYFLKWLNLVIFTLKFKYAQIQASAFFSLQAFQEMPKIGSLFHEKMSSKLTRILQLFPHMFVLSFCCGNLRILKYFLMNYVISNERKKITIILSDERLWDMKGIPAPSSLLSVETSLLLVTCK